VTETFTIFLTYTRHLKFEVKAKDAATAHHEVVSGFMYDGTMPDDEEMPDLELAGIKTGDRDIRISSDLDTWGPKDEKGLCRWKFRAYEDDDNFYGHKLSEGYDLDVVVKEALAAARPQAA